MWGLLFVYLSSPAYADTTFTVNSTGDQNDVDFPFGTFDGSSDAKCDVDSTLDGDLCTLRAAIQEANVTASDDTIDIGVTGTVNLTGALPELSTNIKIVGPGADQLTVRRDTGGDYRIFTVTGDTTNVTISGLTISNGNTVDSCGDGGGISNVDNGTLTVTDSIISGNIAGGDGGGGIYYDSSGDVSLTITDSTISDNTAGAGSAASESGGQGGGIFSDTDLDTKKTTIRNSTISGNTIKGDSAIGGGVYNASGTTEIMNSTITNNTAPDGGGSGVASDCDDQTSTEVLSSIISENSNTDVDLVKDLGDCIVPPDINSFVSRGYNLIGDGNATAAFNQTGDQVIGDDTPGLGPLADNGGPTETHALLAGSPAIDKGPPSTSCPPPDTDQRGVERPQDGDADATPVCDIGSFELEKPPDTQAPRVASTFPRDGGEVGPAANIRATFSEEMQEASVINAFKLFRKGSTNQIDATITYDAATDIAILNPTNNLRRGATYKAVVTTQAKDEAGNRLDQNDSRAGLQQKVWFFEIDN